MAGCTMSEDKERYISHILFTSQHEDIHFALKYYFLMSCINLKNLILQLLLFLRNNIV